MLEKLKNEFIIRNSADMNAVIALVRPVIAAKKPFRLTLHKGLKRTIDQNALLHAVFQDCANKILSKYPEFRCADSTNACDADWWKRELKSKLGKTTVHFDLEERPTVFYTSTTEYTTKELSDFCEKIVAYMKTEYNVDIKLPDELEGK